MRHLSLECRWWAWFLEKASARQMQRPRQRQMLGKCFYALNAAFISWMPLRSVIFRFQNANTKAKCKCKGKCIGKWFLCPKCGIYLLNAALKRDFLDFRMQIQRQKMQMQRQMRHRKNAKAKANGFYALNAAFISWMPLRSVIFRFQNANTKAKCKCKGKCIGKCFLMP